MVKENLEIEVRDFILNNLPTVTSIFMKKLLLVMMNHCKSCTSGMMSEIWQTLILNILMLRLRFFH